MAENLVGQLELINKRGLLKNGVADDLTTTGTNRDDDDIGELAEIMKEKVRNALVSWF